jgi:hypothetical protein
VTVTTVVMKLAKSLLGRAEPEAKPASAKKAINPYHAVSIAPGYRNCAAARALRDHRFLSRQAPALPLKECDSTECTCRYEHHDDRRRGQRRARDLGVSIDGYEGDERRLKPKRGRRNADT